MYQFDRPRFQNELSSGSWERGETLRTIRRTWRDSRLLRVGVSAGVVRLQARIPRGWTPCPLPSLSLRSHIVVHHVAVAVDVPVVVVVLGVDKWLGDVLL